MKQQSNVDDGFEKIRQFVDLNFNNISQEVQTFRTSIEKEFLGIDKMTKEVEKTVANQNLKQQHFESM